MAWIQGQFKNGHYLKLVYCLTLREFVMRVYRRSLYTSFVVIGQLIMKFVTRQRNMVHSHGAGTIDIERLVLVRWPISNYQLVRSVGNANCHSFEYK